MVSITLIVALPEMIDNLTSETVISVTAKAEIVVSILNQIEYFGDETVTVVECKVFVKKPYESHGESGHGIKAEKAGAGVTLSPLRSTKVQLLAHKPFNAMHVAPQIQVVSWVPVDGIAVRETVSLRVVLFVVETLPTAKTGQPRNVSETFRGWPSCFNALSVTHSHRWACSPQQGSPSGNRGFPQRQRQSRGWSQTRFPQTHSRSATGKGSGHPRSHHLRGRSPGGRSRSQG